MVIPLPRGWDTAVRSNSRGKASAVPSISFSADTASTACNAARFSPCGRWAGLRTRHQCSVFKLGGDLGIARLKGSLSQLTRRTCLPRVSYRPVLPRPVARTRSLRRTRGTFDRELWVQKGHRRVASGPLIPKSREKAPRVLANFGSDHQRAAPPRGALEARCPQAARLPLFGRHPM
jgi:hypothetical protein